MDFPLYICQKPKPGPDDGPCQFIYDFRAHGLKCPLEWRVACLRHDKGQNKECGL
jgi:hypothetical protein